MNIFIIGPRKCGKSILAKYLAEKLKYNPISVDYYIRILFPNEQDVDNLTQLTCDTLVLDPNFFSKKIRKHLLIFNNNIVDGIMNPQDFAKLFNPTSDVVIWLTNTNTMESNSSDFERFGLEIIYSNIFWLIKNKIFNSKQYFYNYLSNFDDLSNKMEIIYNQIVKL